MQLVLGGAGIDWAFTAGTCLSFGLFKRTRRTPVLESRTSHRSVKHDGGLRELISDGACEGQWRVCGVSDAHLRPEVTVLSCSQVIAPLHRAGGSSPNGTGRPGNQQSANTGQSRHVRREVRHWPLS
ncbi:uncharacterized protein SCHCODRAFT_02627130 [Schizophyllum commune H4-8]|uniref:uncharacterized protein n=1 Tax=Schizophyllum commune (strain H4-8 / FGSC 9210) TaxID=578458 RepID=UPI0021610112|nr:uncharacterized protein SCHCODRAFT_02627130 [Schizophyllum commune H4-8]KAI5892785.1 hypothetical protein SCHCODRAFT_02627130 [Schizophyllum commune H4-8]